MWQLILHLFAQFGTIVLLNFFFGGGNRAFGSDVVVVVVVVVVRYVHLLHLLVKFDGHVSHMLAGLEQVQLCRNLPL